MKHRYFIHNAPLGTHIFVAHGDSCELEQVATATTINRALEIVRSLQKEADEKELEKAAQGA